MGALRKFDPETRERAVRMYHDHLAEHGGGKLAARKHVGALLDINQATLRNWIEKDRPIVTARGTMTVGEQDAEFDAGERHVIRHEHYYVMRLRSRRQVPRAPQEADFTPEWHCWDEAMAGLAFDEERRWLVWARCLLDGEESARP